MKKAIQIHYNETFEKKCKFAAEAGFEYISVCLEKYLNKTDYECKQITEDIQRILDENHLSCIQTHAFCYDLRLSSEIIQSECEEAIRQGIYATAQFGAEWIVIHPRSSISSGFRVSQSFEDNKKPFSEYLEFALNYGTGIAAENLPTFHIGDMMPFYPCNFEDLCELIDYFNDEKLRACWDFGHANLMHFDQTYALCFLGDRVKCTHVHNNFKNDDSHNSPDTGNIPWGKIIPALRSTGYDGSLTLESHCYYNGDDEAMRVFSRHNYECLCWLEKVGE